MAAVTSCENALLLVCEIDRRSPIGTWKSKNPKIRRQFNALSSKNAGHAHYRNLAIIQHSSCFELLNSFCILECQNPAMAEKCLALASEVRFRILPTRTVQCSAIKF